MCEEEKDKVTKNQSFLCAVFGGLSLPNTHIFPDNKRYEEVDGVRKEKERLTTDHQPNLLLDEPCASQKVNYSSNVLAGCY